MLATLAIAVVFAQAAPEPAPTSSPPAAGSAAADSPSGLTVGDDSLESLITPPTSKAQRVQGVVAGGGGYQFRTDLDGGGDVAITRFTAGTQFRFLVTDALSIGLNLGYRFDRYEFGGNVFPALGPGVNPWRDIHTLGLGAIANWAIDDRWSVSAGPIAQIAGEESVDVGDAVNWGGLVAASCKVSDTLLVGGGVAVVDPIEDDVKVFPQIVIDWQINDALRLTSRGGPTAVVRQGLELVYSPAPPFELAIGGRYETDRFRLSDGNTFKDGIGEQQSIPAWVRISWLPLPTLRVDLFGGVTAWTEFKLSDSGGGVLAEEDLDPAPFVAAYVTWRF